MLLCLRYLLVKVLRSRERSFIIPNCPLPVNTFFYIFLNSDVLLQTTSQYSHFFIVLCIYPKTPTLIFRVSCSFSCRQARLFLLFTLFSFLFLCPVLFLLPFCLTLFFLFLSLFIALRLFTFSFPLFFLFSFL